MSKDREPQSLREVECNTTVYGPWSEQLHVLRHLSRQLITDARRQLDRSTTMLEAWRAGQSTCATLVEHWLTPEPAVVMQALGPAASGSPEREPLASRLGQGPAEQQDRAAPPRGRGQLSPRQLQIAALIRQGLTNAEIAAHLVLTPGTVANHVANILDRLDFRSRAQIAAWAAERGLGDPDRVDGARDGRRRAPSFR